MSERESSVLNFCDSIEGNSSKQQSASDLDVADVPVERFQGSTT
jgi:hypothetical protein